MHPRFCAVRLSFKYECKQAALARSSVGQPGAAALLSVPAHPSQKGQGVGCTTHPWSMPAHPSISERARCGLHAAAIAGEGGMVGGRWCKHVCACTNMRTHAHAQALAAPSSLPCTTYANRRPRWSWGQARAWAPPSSCGTTACSRTECGQVRAHGCV